MSQKQVEKNSLIVSAIVNLVMAGTGIWVFAATGIHALFLDGVFSLIGCISNVFAIVISTLSKKRTKTYPEGMYFIEPLYAIMKSLLTLTLMVVSVVATAGVAHSYFVHGTGEPMNIGPVLPYTVAMVVLCFGLSFYNKWQNKKTGYISTILTAESKSNFVDGILSLGVGIAIVLLRFINIDGALGFLHYTGDFFVTTILCLISLKAPIAVIISSFKELSNGVTGNVEILRNVKSVMAEHLDGITAEAKYKVYKVGMHIRIRIDLTREINMKAFEKLIQARNSIMEQLKVIYDSVEIIFAF